MSVWDELWKDSKYVWFWENRSPSWLSQVKSEGDKFKEKAEKWDKYTLDGQNITPEIIEAIEVVEKKLEAIKEWNRKIGEKFIVGDSWARLTWLEIEELNEILEGKT